MVTVTTLPAADSHVWENPQMENPMSTFATFRDGLGGEFIRQEFGLNISGCLTWKDFTSAMLANRARLGGDTAFIKRATDRFHRCSTGEGALMLAVLWTSDYRWLADQLAEQGKTTFLRLMEFTHGDMAEAASACIARRDR